MGDPFVGIVHPCKVYNIRALGIPYLYIGPPESHVTELRPAFTATHGDVDAVVRHVRTAAAGAASGTVRFSASVFTRTALLGQMVTCTRTQTGQPSTATSLGLNGLLNSEPPR